MSNRELFIMVIGVYYTGNQQCHMIKCYIVLFLCYRAWNNHWLGWRLPKMLYLPESFNHLTYVLYNLLCMSYRQQKTF